MKSGLTHAIGRRKTSVARVFLKSGAGEFKINDLDYKAYFGRIALDSKVIRPLTVLGLADKYDVSVNVNGGGKASQAEAIRMAIARALVKIDEAVKKQLRAEGFLTRDPRAVERKKYGRHKARKRPQFSKR